ncbi:MAG TPA: hypothetical protein DDZ51_26775 [Planctomycetaceae bacterium]|nr:hypothetical protein [Planctomycetaceae bacterium]
MFQNRLLPISLSAAFIFSTLTGCGKSDTSSQADLAPAATRPGAIASTTAPLDINAAKDAVSQFLDAVRRGGDTGGAHALLTKDACAVLEGLGRSVQPIGSPAAKFVVTRSEAVEGHANSALVHSTWSEPTETGTFETFQVVWALEWEQKAWKISGLAMELDPTQEPMIIDFEDHAQMANLFRGETEGQANSSAVKSGNADNVSQAPGSTATF